MIDAHQHFWQLSQPYDYAWLDSPDLGAIRRDYLPNDLKPHLDTTGVRHSIFVQTQHNLEENRWVLSLAAQTDRIFRRFPSERLDEKFVPVRQMSASR